MGTTNTETIENGNTLPAHAPEIESPGGAIKNQQPQCLRVRSSRGITIDVASVKRESVQSVRPGWSRKQWSNMIIAVSHRNPLARIPTSSPCTQPPFANPQGAVLLTIINSS